MLNEHNRAVSDSVRAFLSDHIHNYEQLDVLLFLHTRHQQSYSTAAVAAALHIADELAAKALNELANRGLVEIPEPAAARYRLGSSDELRRLVDLVAQAYSEHYVQVVRLMSANAIERMRGALPFLRGAVAMACLVAGLLFLRLWRLSDERLLLFFSLGFAVFAVHWIGLGMLGGPAEAHHWLYLLRLLAFVLIIAGIIDKNRRSTRP